MTDGPGGPDLGGLSPLRRHLDRLQESGDLSPEALLQDLETVYEELRTSEEEVRVQQEHITRLVSDHASEHRQFQRMLALLPVAVLTTDQQGVIRTANAAAAALLRVPGQRLVGKPVFALVAPEDRSELRRRVGQRLHEPARHVVTFLRRQESPVGVEVLLTPRPGPWAELSWVLLVAEGGGATSEQHRLSSALMRLASLLPSAEDLTGLLTRAAQTVREGTSEDASVSICVGSPLEPVAVGTTSGVASAVDGAQINSGEGPAVTAYAEGVTVVSEDLAVDARWADLRGHLPEGVGAAVAEPLSDGGAVAGVLVVHLPPGQGSRGASTATGPLASTVASLVTEFSAREELADVAENLRRAMQSRAVIEQAKGIIMTRRRCSDEEAFAHLVRVSSTTHVKLRDVARRIVEEATRDASGGA
jgi:PAS domain S-box-containing protein